MRRCFLVLLSVLSASASSLFKRNALDFEVHPESAWQTDWQIPFTFSTNFTNSDYKRMIGDAFRLIEANSCLQFQDASTWNDFEAFFPHSILTIVNASAMSCQTDTLGKELDGQLTLIHLGELCFTLDTIIHEIFHSLGVDHTHSRFDRGEFVTLVENNTGEWQDQYSIENSAELTNLGVSYDFDSIMHYQNTNDELIARDPLFQQNLEISNTRVAHSDFLLLNRLYKCFANCSDARTLCENGGFVNPHRCTSCICPRGFSGAFCDLARMAIVGEKRCGGSVYASDEWKTISRRIAAPGECHFHFVSSRNKRVEIELLELAPSDENCTLVNGWVEVRLGRFGYGGYKFLCDARLPNATLKSVGNRAVVSLQAKGPGQSFTLRFRSAMRENESLPKKITKSGSGLLYSLPAAVLFICVVLL